MATQPIHRDYLTRLCRQRDIDVRVMIVLSTPNTYQLEIDDQRGGHLYNGCVYSTANYIIDADADGMIAADAFGLTQLRNHPRMHGSI